MVLGTRYTLTSSWAKSRLVLPSGFVCEPPAGRCGRTFLLPPPTSRKATGRASPSNRLQPLFLWINGVRWLFSASRASLGPRQGRPRPFPGFSSLALDGHATTANCSKANGAGALCPPSRVGAGPLHGARDSLQPRALGPRLPPGSYLTNRAPGRSRLWPPGEAVRPPPPSYSWCSPWRGRTRELRDTEQRPGAPWWPGAVGEAGSGTLECPPFKLVVLTIKHAH